MVEYFPPIYNLKEKQIDKIIYFGNFITDCNDFFNYFNVNIKSMPVTNKSKRPNNFMDLYDKESFDLTKEYYKEDLTTFGY